jgi:actin related protein 2/3 complex subunit 3
MAYHSDLKSDGAKLVCGFAIMPLKTKFKGPAPVQREDGPDIVDEAIDFYRANVLFRNFEVKTGADRVIIYLTLYISQCLTKLGNYDMDGATKALQGVAIENFVIPGDEKWPLNGVTTNPASRADSGTMRIDAYPHLTPLRADIVRQYLTQLRQELGNRLADRVYESGKLKQPSKWWVCFSKRKFMVPV